MVTACQFEFSGDAFQSASTSNSSVSSTTDLNNNNNNIPGTGQNTLDLTIPTNSPNLFQEHPASILSPSNANFENAKMYEPKGQLEVEGATKDWYAYFPENSQIDNSGAINQFEWKMPQGTILRKDFKINGVLIETRLAEFMGTDNASIRFSNYAYDNSGIASLVTSDMASPIEPNYQVPGPGKCLQCHGGMSNRNFFNAAQLTNDNLPATYWSLSVFNQKNMLSAPEANAVHWPGNENEQQLFADAFANCASCHTDNTNRPEATPKCGFSGYYFGFTGAATVESTQMYESLVNHPTKPLIQPGNSSFTFNSFGQTLTFQELIFNERTNTPGPMPENGFIPLAPTTTPAWLVNFDSIVNNW